jgi:hypothetical protein
VTAVRCAAVLRPLAVVLLAVAAAAPSAAQTRWERQVQRQLRVIAADIAPQGWRYASDPLIGQLSQGERETMRVALREGGEYAIVALCDEDCRDLDVAVMGENDAVLARSRGWSDKPLLELRPAATAKYRVVVTMAHCGTGPCAFGVGIFHK